MELLMVAGVALATVLFGVALVAGLRTSARESQARMDVLTNRAETGGSAQTRQVQLVPIQPPRAQDANALRLPAGLVAGVATSRQQVAWSRRQQQLSRARAEQSATVAQEALGQESRREMPRVAATTRKVARPETDYAEQHARVNRALGR